MKQLTCLSLVVVVVVVSVQGQQEVEEASLASCKPCESVTCSKQIAYEECTWGRVRDPCHCCDECAKGPGEVCGAGNGTCLPGFKCVQRTAAPSGAGRCEWRPLPTFLNPKLPAKQPKQ